VFSRVFIAEEVDGVWDKGSSNAIMVYVQALMEAHMNMPLKSVSFSEEAFSWSKGKHLILGLLSSNARSD
jgi:hypothetical protein